VSKNLGNKMGDALAMVAEYILHDLQPFPGDEKFTPLLVDDWEVDNRFSYPTRRGHEKLYG
jgi:hypothetical protein